VLCVGLGAATLAENEREALETLGPGGIVLFARNVSTRERTQALAAAARDAIGGAAPALVCIDEEGGRVSRLHFGATLPAAMALGAAADEQLAERAGTVLAHRLRSVGVNVDFAPVLDLALDARSTVIGTRSFGDEPERAAALGSAFLRGLQCAGVAATVKHFPGHGATAADSHRELPIVTASAVTLQGRELVPFATAFAAGAAAVMTAHVVIRAFDAERPATLSPRVLTELLRAKLGFAGVCFTDCLEMDAIAKTVGTTRGAVLALAAGADCLLVSHDLALAREVRDAIVAAVDEGELPLARVEEAAARIAVLRRSFLSTGIATDGEAELDEVSREIARRAIVVVRGEPRLDPARPVTVISFEGAAGDGIALSAAERPSLSLALRRRRFRSELLRVPLATNEPNQAMRDLLLELLRTQGDRNVVVVARRAHLHEAQRAALDAVFVTAPHTVAISALEPFDVPALAGAETVVCTFGDDEASVEALADVLAGVATATGSMPVSLATARI